MFDQFIRSLAAGALDCAVVLFPILIWAVFKKNKKQIRATLLVAAIFLADLILVYLPLAYGSKGMAWAWQGKIFETTAFLGIAMAIKLRDKAGLVMPRRLIWIPMGVLIGFLYSTGDFWKFFTGSLEARRSDLNIISYELTMPGIAEELSFRGVMLGVMDEAFGRPVKFLGETFGVGYVATTTLFFLGHGLMFDEHWKLNVAVEMIPDFVIFGTLMCWLRYRSGSILPCVLVHNVNNAIGFILSALKH